MIRREALLFVGIVLATGTSRANSRFPGANQLFEQPGNPDVLVVRTTFGLLTSRDAGTTFDWICEDVLGVTGDFDPPIGVFGDGSIAAAPGMGLTMSHDGGCDWNGAAIAPNLPVLDVAVCRGLPDRGVAIDWHDEGSGAFASTVWTTTDDGATWSAAATIALPGFVPATIDVAPSDASRVYVSGTYAAKGGLSGALLASLDGGGTFVSTDVDLGGAQSLYIAAVDSKVADIVYLRSSASNGDSLFVSKDGGKTVVSVAKTKGKMLGLALSPDGQSVAVGGDVDGLAIASTSSFVFVPVATFPVSALAWTARGLYVVGAKDAPFAIALSADAGATFTPLLAALADVRGPVACSPSSNAGATCDGEWSTVQKTLPGGATGGAGGLGGSGGATSGTAGATEAPAASSNPTSGCGCRLGGDGEGTSAAVTILALALTTWRRRRC